MSNPGENFVLPLSVYTDTEYNQLRRAYLLLIAALIEPHLIDQDINDYRDTIITIEQSCYLQAVEIADYELLLPDFSIIQFEQLYRTRITRITKNLDIQSEVGDDYLVTAIIDGKIDIPSISKLLPEELSPSKNRKMIEELTARRTQKISIKVSTMYRCPQKGCGKNETTVRSAQMRSLDEGETLIITCIFCSHKWFC
jgi:DNA-directed RNA polymerase subunit M/transcription elongation factor TFIIS